MKSIPNSTIESVYKSNGKMKGERIMVKTFRDSGALHSFLNSQTNNDWKENSGSLCGSTLPSKKGTYAYAGGAWHNVKSMDPSVLCHI